VPIEEEEEETIRTAGGYTKSWWQLKFRNSSPHLSKSADCNREDPEADE
jgi:hypothetical protein